MHKEISQKLLTFIEKSPSCFHVVANMEHILKQQGFTELSEGEKWALTPGRDYYVTRNGSSLIAFRIPSKDAANFQIIASHSDSPCFKIKENPELKTDGKYVRLNVEKYGGMLMAPWLDRPLSAAGRVLVENNGHIETRLVNLDRDLLLIPNLAIHMNREVNEGYRYQPQVDMLPLFGGPDSQDNFLKLVAENAGVGQASILSTDLFLYSRVKGCIWGASEEFISSARLDDLQCAFASMEAFLGSSNSSSVLVHCVLDNEEVGSGTKQGAASTFLKDTLTRICICLGQTREDYLIALSQSFMLSADNAHAVHPNHPDKTDASHRAYLNEGIVIKYNAGQKYTTDAVSSAVFQSVCRRAGVPTQNFSNRPDMAGGSTLGNISGNQVALNTVDIGLPQLAMHSPYETAGVMDTWYLVQAAREFYSCRICGDGRGGYEIR